MCMCTCYTGHLHIHTLEPSHFSWHRLLLNMALMLLLSSSSDINDWGFQGHMSPSTLNPETLKPKP